MRTTRPVFGGCLAFAMALGLMSPPRALGWPKTGWMYCRPVTVPKFKATGLPGSDVGVVTMPTAGLAKPDGSDICVTTVMGKDVPSRVLMVGPGDQVRIAFAVYGGTENYQVYFGNPSAPRSAELEIQRGVLLEMWEYPGGSASTLDQVRKVFTQAKKLIGRDFRGNVFLGYNPFGPQNRIASVFTGWLNCQKTGSYVFSISSQDASFLLVDDKVVVENGGWHGPSHDISHRGNIDLKPGLHKLTFYHVNANGDPISVAAWRSPGEDRVWTIPPEAFAPIVVGTPGPLKKYGTQMDIDFIPVHANETFLNNHYLQRYKFQALTSGQAAKTTWQWDFGDGQTSKQADVEHVYLLPGIYTVTLTGRTPTGDLKRTNNIYVSRPWDRVTKADLDPLGLHADILATYDFGNVSPEGAVWVVEVFKRLKRSAPLVQVGEAFIARDQAPAETVTAVVLPYVDVMVAQGQADKAIQVLKKASQMTKDPAVCAGMLAKAGKICLLDKSKLAQALELFETVIKRYAALTTAAPIRDARVGVGDVWRARGNYEKAAAAYAAGGGGEEAAADKAPIIRGDFARHAEDYITQGDLESAAEYLDRWEDTFPLDKLEGYWSLMRVRLLLAQKRQAEAILEAEVLAAVNPASNYAPELLMLAGGTYQAMGKTQEYKDTLKRIAEKFPESPFAVEAAKKLKG